MSMVLEMRFDSETLTSEEIISITGCSRRAAQIAWFENQGWIFVKNKAGEPIIGRLYARLKLSGINPNTLASGGWNPDFKKLK